MIFVLAEAEKNIKNAAVVMSPKYFDFRMISLWFIFVILITVILKVDVQNSLDLRLYYSNEEAIKFLRSLSRKDTYRYLITEVINIAFILTYTYLLYLSLKRLFVKKKKIKYLALIPGSINLYESSILISVLSSILTEEALDTKPNPWIGLIVVFKWITIAMTLLLFLLGSGYRLKNGLIKKQIKTTN